MSVLRLPLPVLRPFVAQVWASADPCGAADVSLRREHALPSGAMHLVIRLSDNPLRLAEGGGHEPARSVAPALIGGARSRFYVRELAGPSCSVGAVLRPGAAECLLGTPADELAERHTPLESLWGAEASRLRERLLELRGLEGRLALFESALAARLPRVHGLHPAVADALARFQAEASVAEAVRHSGLSHRHFIQLFRQHVGLPPKAYLQVQRFQRALPLLRSNQGPSLATLAAELGFSDQSHFQREFMRFSGATPLVYRRTAGAGLNHLPVDGDRRGG